MPDKIYPLAVLPGIQKDGTKFSAQTWTDGEWTRFYRSLPKKIGGYVQISSVENIPRGNFIVPVSPNFNAYVGDFKSLRYYTMDPSGVVVGSHDGVNRTPVPFNENPYNLWSFDMMYSAETGNSTLIAHVAPNLYSIDSGTEGVVFFGDTYSEEPLESTGIEVSGGIVCLSPYLVMFGNNGQVKISHEDNLSNVLEDVRVTAQKIVAGIPTRGGSNSPAAILWSLDSVIRMTFIGPELANFNFDTISSESSILSSRSVIEYDSFYYWVGVDRFMYYDGTVRELKNTQLLEWFFSNLDYSQRQKVWATKVTKWGEIWWHFPSKNSPNGECDLTAIYNVREDRWYPSPSSRCCGYFNQTFIYPVWSSSQPEQDGKYSIWMHENGVDKNIGGVLSPIKSNIETVVISWPGFDPNSQRQDLNRWSDLYRIEPDFIQKGPMTLTVKGREYANSPEVSSEPYVFYGSDSDNPTEKIDIREQRRLLTLKFESNVIGGDYTMGQILMIVRVGDVRS